MEPQSSILNPDTCLEPMSPHSFICPTAMDNSMAPDALSDTVSVKSESSSYDSSYQSSLPSTASPPKKKRKSWGQVLPTPTTNLPPRKRAKTEEEKAQRKYERVQRNRHAAHQSRMRKQEEMEKLQCENAQLKEHNTELQDRVSRLEAALSSVSKQTVPSNGPMTPPASFDPPTPVLSSPDSTPSDDIDLDTPPYSPITQPESMYTQTKGESSDTQSAALCSQQWTLDSPLFHRDRRRSLTLLTSPTICELLT